MLPYREKGVEPGIENNEGGDAEKAYRLSKKDQT
jgi:hypothetical protein